MGLAVGAGPDADFVACPRLFLAAEQGAGWADAPPRRLVFAPGIPKLDRALPCALPRTSRQRRWPAVANVREPDGQPLTVAPQQLRNTYDSTLANAGMSLQALMALLGHVTHEMTNREIRCGFRGRLLRLAPP